MSARKQNWRKGPVLELSKRRCSAGVCLFVVCLFVFLWVWCCGVGFFWGEVVVVVGGLVWFVFLIQKNITQYLGAWTILPSNWELELINWTVFVWWLVWRFCFCLLMLMCLCSTKKPILSPEDFSVSWHQLFEDGNSSRKVYIKISNNSISSSFNCT